MSEQLESDPWTKYIEGYLTNFIDTEVFIIKDVAVYGLKFERDDADLMVCKRIAKVLKELGYTKKRAYFNKKQQYVYAKVHNTDSFSMKAPIEIAELADLE